MIIDPKQVDYKDCYKLMIGSVVPRPIAFVSTRSSDGVRNLAPFSYFTAITSSPPTICVSPGRRPDDGERKDTLRNIEETGEFVVNVVTESMGEAMNEAATDFPPDVDEFEMSGLTPAPCQMIKAPRIAESPINMECKVYKVLHIGPAGAGGGALVIGEIVLFHIESDLYKDGRIDIHKLKPLGRLAGSEYTTLGRIIKMKRGKHEPKGS